MALVTHIKTYGFSLCVKVRINVRRLRLLTLTLTPAKALPSTRFPTSNNPATGAAHGFSKDW